MSATVGAAVTRFGLDGRGDVSSLVSSTTMSGVESSVLSESIQRDRLGRIVTRTERAGTGPSRLFDYGYDAAGRLTQVTVDGAVTETFAYDSTGGLIARGSGVLSSSITVDGHGRPTASASGVLASWSPDGELATLASPGLGSAALSYDGFGRIAAVTLADGRVGSYRYDGLGRRLSLRIDGTLVRRFVYGAGLFPRARVGVDGGVLERYVYASQAHVPELIVRRDGQRLRLVTDALGSVRAVVDVDSGVVVQRLSYDAYGAITQDTAPGTQPFGFKGALSDPVAEGAGLVWMGVRAYIPSLARFATPDPVGLAAAWNEHDALGGDPINLIDADGQWPSRQGLANFSAGVGDAALGVFCAFQCNPGAALRSSLGIDDKVDMCTGAYTGGSVSAAFAVPLPGPGKLKAVEAAAEPAAKLASEVVRRDPLAHLRKAPQEVKAVIGDTRQAMDEGAGLLDKKRSVKAADPSNPTSGNKVIRIISALARLSGAG